MRRVLTANLELDDDPARVDVDAVHVFLSQQSYWARDRTREQVETAVRSAARVVGLYDADQQIGFARAIATGDGSVRLADVYVLSTHRGRGLGTELVREMVDAGPLRHLSWSLRTADAHGLYARFGFRAGEGDAMVRDRRPGREPRG